jgi:hypothetical protein
VVNRWFSLNFERPEYPGPRPTTSSLASGQLTAGMFATAAVTAPPSARPVRCRFSRASITSMALLRLAVELAPAGANAASSQIFRKLWTSVPNRFSLQGVSTSRLKQWRKQCVNRLWHWYTAPRSWQAAFWSGAPRRIRRALPSR